MYYGKAIKYKYNLLYSKFAEENPTSDLVDVPLNSSQEGIHNGRQLVPKTAKR